MDEVGRGLAPNTLGNTFSRFSVAREAVGFQSTKGLAGQTCGLSQNVPSQRKIRRKMPDPFAVCSTITTTACLSYSPSSSVM